MTARRLVRVSHLFDCGSAALGLWGEDFSAPFKLHCYTHLGSK
jgi:hypothetical protein